MSRFKTAFLAFLHKPIIFIPSICAVVAVTATIVIVAVAQPFSGGQRGHSISSSKIVDIDTSILMQSSSQVVSQSSDVQSTQVSSVQNSASEATPPSSAQSSVPNNIPTSSGTAQTNAGLPSSSIELNKEKVIPILAEKVVKQWESDLDGNSDGIVKFNTLTYSIDDANVSPDGNNYVASVHVVYDETLSNGQDKKDGYVYWFKYSEHYQDWEYTTKYDDSLTIEGHPCVINVNYTPKS